MSAETMGTPKDIPAALPPLPTAGLRAEGIRTSQRPLGRLASRWIAVLDRLDPRLKGRVMRGRTLSRGGRVHQIEFAPGVALAEVSDAGIQHPTVRVRTLGELEWREIVSALCGDLSLLAELFEGQVPDGLLAALDQRGISMLPSPEEIDGDCDCGDWAVPCAHGAALHHVLGDALDGDPFLLFTLRGRTREQLELALRLAWGDEGRPEPSASPDDRQQPDADPFASPAPLPPMMFRFSARPGPPGMVALGPLAGDEDLLRALTPLYNAGSSTAVAMALAEGSPDAARRRRRSMVPTAVPSAPEPAEPGPADLTERIVDLLAEADDGATTEALARGLGISAERAREELCELESMGIVYRGGRGKLRWWLG